MDQTIGDRIRTRRKLSNLSVRRAAEYAGISHTHWSRIERGERGADNRFILAEMARVLRCSVPDLTGTPGAPPRTSDEATLAGDVNSLLAALVETDLDDDPTVSPVGFDRLEYESTILDDLRTNADYAGVAGRLAAYTRQLHAATVMSTDARNRGLRLTVLGSVRTGGVLREVGQRAEAFLAAERAQDAAEQLNEPVMLAAAARSRAAAAMGCGSMARAEKYACKGLLLLEGHMDTYGAKEVAGHLHLVSAMSLYGMSQPDEAETHLSEAEKLASITGDTDTFKMFFGPTNLQFWRLAITVDGGDPHDAIEIARTTNPAKVDSIDRQGMFYLDAARALSRVGTRESDAAAIRMILTAERLTPQRIQRHPLAKETLRQVVERIKRSAVDAKLRGLCERIGVAK